MKLKSIANLCKVDKRVILYEDNAGEYDVYQWIGNGGAVYPITGLPRLDREAVITIFDIPEKNVDKWFISIDDLPAMTNFGDTDENEQLIKDWMYFHIQFNGRLLKPLKTDDGICFIDTAYLAPLSDVWDEMRLYARKGGARGTYIVAKVGMLVHAVIAPYNALCQQFVESLNEIAEWSADAFAKLETSDEDEAAQHETIMDIDPETGEIKAEESEENETEDADAEN